MSNENNGLDVGIKVTADTAGAKETQKEIEKTIESAKRLESETKKSHDVLHGSWAKLKESVIGATGAFGQLLTTLAEVHRRLLISFALGFAVEAIISLAKTFKDAIQGTIIPSLDNFASKFNASIEKFKDAKAVTDALAAQQHLYADAINATNTALDDQIKKIDARLGRDQKLLEAQHKHDVEEAETETDPVKRAQRLANVESGFALAQNRLGQGSNAAKRAAIQKALASLDVAQGEVQDAQLNPDKVRAQFAAANAAQDRVALTKGRGDQIAAEIRNIEKEAATYVTATSQAFSSAVGTPTSNKSPADNRPLIAEMRERRLREELGINISDVQRAAADASTLRSGLPAKFGTKDEMEDFLRAHETGGAKAFQDIELKRRELIKSDAELQAEGGNDAAVGKLNRQGVGFKNQKNIEDAAKEEAQRQFQLYQKEQQQLRQDNEIGKRLLLGQPGASINDPSFENLFRMADTLNRLDGVLGPVIDKLESRIDDLGRV